MFLTRVIVVNDLWWTGKQVCITNFFTNYKLKVAVNLMVACTQNIACLFLMTP